MQTDPMALSEGIERVRNEGRPWHARKWYT